MKHEIAELNLTVKTYNVLKRAGINCLEDICDKTPNELRKTRNLGTKSYKEILSKLEEYGLKLKEETL